MRWLAFPLAVLALAAPSLARAATRIYSTRALHQVIPDGGSVERGIVVRDRGPISRVAVSVRIQHPADGELTLSLISPAGRTILLSARRGGDGANFGTGAGCGGGLTVFDSDYGDPIAKGTAPFDDLAYEPEQKLSSLNGETAFGKWRLRVEDALSGNTGVLRCAKLEISRNVVETRRVRKGAVAAELAFRERSYVVGDVHLRIRRAGRLVLDTPLVRVNCRGCPNNGLRLNLQSTPITIRDLDSDREPEVLYDLYTGGAHCCSYTLIFRYLPASRRYVRTLGYWGNAGYRLADLDKDGKPELVSSDDRFAYAFAAYVFSAEPPQIWRLAGGQLEDVTRLFPKVIAADAAEDWRTYSKYRSDRSADVRGVIAAYVADQFLLGRPEEGWRRLDLAYRRGDLSRGDDIWPRGKAYLKALRQFLVANGYSP